MRETHNASVVGIHVLKGSFYIEQDPVRWTAQVALHFLPLPLLLVQMKNHEPRNVLSHELFLLICTFVDGILEQIKRQPWAIFFNLHQSKINSGLHHLLLNHLT